MGSTKSPPRARAHESDQRANVVAAGHEGAPRDRVCPAEARDRGASADDEGRARCDGRARGMQRRNQGEIESHTDDRGNDESVGGAAGAAAGEQSTAEDQSAAKPRAPGSRKRKGVTERR